MKCSECEGQIFEGELDRDAVVHLAECDGCRALDQEARLNASALASMREDVMPVGRARRWPLSGRWIAAAAAVVVAAVGLSYRPEAAVAPPQVTIVEPLPVEPALPAPPARPAPIRRARPTKPVPPPAEPLLVKFLTDDPDVVIYWQIDPVQGEKVL
jgi:hypothetical protein